MLRVAVARSYSDGNAIRYVLPVLWMTSCFHTMERMGQNHPIGQVAAPGATSAVPDCILLRWPRIAKSVM